MWKIATGLLSGIIGIFILINVTLENEYVSWAADNMMLQFVAALIGLAFIHLGYRLVTSGWRRQ
ncbi:ABC oligopeptide transporter, inner membrane subunit OppC [Dehalogenimonas lykanthroporepellens BL-DC-9]|jgi:hypothetical protein|nr:ABC oligopeptide transporter, inner membrane subunit OppC [Dehalogenimonas lykanthroporepellens BL-DC-9]